ncbi:hypothetical protein J5X84_00595 [Streptosporangiaceae bacterium NEAU-GS5]|nr:hypothetical protein [Streptosporangiaceae bacterium NEAU-GS5]
MNIGGPDPDPVEAASAFIDVRQSTDLISLHGVRVIRDHLQIMFSKVIQAVEDNGGEVCDIHGDGALAVFYGVGRVDRALAAAATVQRMVQEHFGPSRAATSSSRIMLRVRIGIDDSSICSGSVSDRNGRSLNFWVGGNIADKVSKAMEQSREVGITQDAFNLLGADARTRYSWSNPVDVLIGGRVLPIRTCLTTALPSSTPTADSERKAHYG